MLQRVSLVLDHGVDRFLSFFLSLWKANNRSPPAQPHEMDTRAVIASG
jgi:hypothetical protein